MTSRIPWAVAGLLGAAIAVAWAQETVFRVDVRLVRLLATVKDLNGEPVGGLQKTDFTVYDSGVVQEIALFERHTETPLSVALLVDTSASTARKLKQETVSVLAFLRTFFGEGHPEDAVALYSFDHDVTLQSSFTRRVTRLENELRRLRAEAGTSLYDAIYFAARALESRRGRRVILIVSDGADTTSAKTFQEALEAAHAADAAIYAVLVVPVEADAGRHIAGENALIGLGAATGGKVFSATLGERLDAVFSEILRDLRTQYLIGYYPKNLPYSKERFHRIEVKMNRPDLRVVTRSGYYVDYEGTTERGPTSGGPFRIP
jgi:Ca-activated chloride channel family protein